MQRLFNNVPSIEVLIITAGVSRLSESSKKGLRKEKVQGYGGVPESW